MGGPSHVWAQGMGHRMGKLRHVVDASPLKAHEWLLTALVLAPLGLVLLLAPDDAALRTGAAFAGLTGSLLLLVAALLSYLTWRIKADPREGWVVTVLVLVTGQVTVTSAFAIAPGRGLEAPSGWSLVVCAATSLTAAVLAAVGLRVRSAGLPDPLAVGLGLGVAMVVARAAVTTIDHPAPAALAPAVIVVTLVCHGWLAVAVVMTRSLPRWISRRLAATFVLVGVGAIGAVGGPLTDLVSNGIRAAAGVVLTGSAFVLLGRSFDKLKARTASLEGWLLDVESSARRSQERLHEVKATLAGLVSANSLLTDPSLPPKTRARLQATITSELERVERLVAGTRQGQGPVDLDETLGVLLSAHEARGRSIHWEPTGVQVVGCHDAVAEAVNILLENMAVHGGQGGGRIDVTAEDGVVQIAVTDEGPGVPEDLRSTIFEWGASREGSPGQGIGLHLARRLVAEQGGSLHLADEVEHGSRFVITLPAARRSDEYDDVRAS